MLLKAVLIVCVVRKERKTDRRACACEFYFLFAAGSGRLREGHAETSYDSRATFQGPVTHIFWPALMTHLAKSEATCTNH
jgi:hypothetical protein